MEKDSKEVAPIMGIFGEKEQQSRDNVATELHQLIKVYDHLFQEPTKLSPKRNYDHHIPLIPGAQPVNVKPYRYASQRKVRLKSKSPKC